MCPFSLMHVKTSSRIRVFLCSYFFERNKLIEEICRKEMQGGLFTKTIEKKNIYLVKVWLGKKMQISVKLTRILCFFFFFVLFVQAVVFLFEF